MRRITKGGRGIMKSGEKGVMRDSGIAPAQQKVNHYDIASYKRLRLFAELIGINEATFNEEKEAVEKLVNQKVL